MTTADVNGDGKEDILVANYNSGTVSVLLNTSRSPAMLDFGSVATAPGAATGTVMQAGSSHHRRMRNRGPSENGVTDDITNAMAGQGLPAAHFLNHKIIPIN